MPRVYEKEISKYLNLLFVGLQEGDGASTTAVNFASAMAGDCGLKVLLVDANLRTPSLHETFKIDQAPGLKQLVRNGDDLSSPGVKVGPGNLYGCPAAGPLPGLKGSLNRPGSRTFSRSQRSVSTM